MKKSLIVISSNPIFVFELRKKFNDEFQLVIFESFDFNYFYARLKQNLCLIIDKNSIEEDILVLFEKTILRENNFKFYLINDNNFEDLWELRKDFTSYQISKEDFSVESSSFLYFYRKEIFHEKKDEIREYYGLLESAFYSDCMVLLLGESGSGKDYTAELIHQKSKRRDFPFKNQNIAEWNSNVLETELFGSVYGAFTGAKNYKGLFEITGKGTLLLDEIAELSVDMQAKLLGVLDKNKFSPVGSKKEIELEARLIFATDADLKSEVELGRFRKQLYYRISVLVINIPPLRSHKEDIKSLSVEFAKENKKILSDGAIKKLENYSWPGNVRELKHCIIRACSVSENQLIKEEAITFF